MLRRIFTVSLSTILLSMFASSMHLTSVAYASAVAAKPALTLNRQQGPLGVTLAANGKNFPPGQVGLSYINSQGVPGLFVPPSDTTVQVERGSFVATNLTMPVSGPAGDWKILATDSLGNVRTVRYVVLAAPGQTVAGSPGLTLNPTSGTSGDVITFNGTDWLPQGTTVKLLLQVGGSSIPLLEPPPVSDENGMITGLFHLPSNLNSSQATVVASDAATGALHVQVAILINGATPSASPVVTSAPSPVSTVAPAATSAGGVPGSFDGAMWGPVLLVVGGVIGVAALMLVLFMIPWSARERKEPPVGQL